MNTSSDEYLSGTKWRSYDATSHTRSSDRQIQITDVDLFQVDGDKNWGLIRIKTDSQHQGLGETFPFDEQFRLMEIFSERLIGENPLDTSRIMANLPTNGEMAMAGAAGIEMALWDLKGKIFDAPLYELFGGAFRESVRLYADLHAGETVRVAPSHNPSEIYTPDAYATAATEAVENGYSILKFDLDVPQVEGKDTAVGWLDAEEISRRVEIIKHVRDAVGSNINIGIDLHRSFTKESAIRLGNALEPYNLAWIEDPIPPKSIAGHRDIISSLSTPILTGELFSSPTDAQAYLDQNAADILAPDISNCGIQHMQTIAQMCERESVPLIPHNNLSPVGTFATAHIAASIPNFIAIEHHGYNTNVWDELATRTGQSIPLVTNGEIPLPEGPGIGVELNTDIVEQHKI